MLARAERLVSAADYRRTVRRGRRASSALMTVYAAGNPAGGSWRFGFIVSKAVGNAVTRNRVRRRLKAVCHSMLSNGVVPTTPMDVAFRAHPAAANAPFGELESDARSLLTRITDAVEANPKMRDAR